MRQRGDTPKCCEKGENFIEWHEVRELVGVEDDGWTMLVADNINHPSFTGENHQEVIRFCPFCGERLPEP